MAARRVENVVRLFIFIFDFCDKMMKDGSSEELGKIYALRCTILFNRSHCNVSQCRNERTAKAGARGNRRRQTHFI